MCVQYSRLDVSLNLDSKHARMCSMIVDGEKYILLSFQSTFNIKNITLWHISMSRESRETKTKTINCIYFATWC